MYMEEHGLANKDIYIIDTNRDILRFMNNDAAQLAEMECIPEQYQFPLQLHLRFPRKRGGHQVLRESSRC